MSGFYWNFLPQIVKGIVAEPHVLEENAEEPPIGEGADLEEHPVVDDNLMEARVVEDNLVERVADDNVGEHVDDNLGQRVVEDNLVERVADDNVGQRFVDDNMGERVLEDNLIAPRVIDEVIAEPDELQRDFAEPRAQIQDDVLRVQQILERELVFFERLNVDNGNEDAVEPPIVVHHNFARMEAHFPDLPLQQARGDLNREERRRRRHAETENAKMKFKKLAMENPAPVGNESLLYLVRDVKLFPRAALPADVAHSFVGELKERKDMFHLNFHLYNLNGNSFFNLRISDALPLLMSTPMCLATFQQAEFLVQFFALDDEEWKLIHEEPSFVVSLDYQHWQKDINRQKYNRHDSLSDCFSVTCLNVVPMSCVRSHRSSFKAGISMRIHMKLMNGEVDVLHGIQKCFHPDKALHDLREKMETLLVEGIQSDAVIKAGDNMSYKVHRAILAANSEIFKTMFEIDMNEAKTGKVVTPENISGKVLESILKYVYARNCKDLYDSPKSTTDIMLAAHQYDMHDLVKNCEESLLSMQVEAFTLDRVLSTFQIANLLDMPALMTKCVHIIMRMDVDLSDSSVYMEFNKSHPGHAVKLTEMILRFKKAQPL